MINSETKSSEEEIEKIVASGPIGALTVAGIATAAVVLMWFLFYVLVFVPRGGVQ
jgi:hypothetical protein